MLLTTKPRRKLQDIIPRKMAQSFAARATGPAMTAWASRTVISTDAGARAASGNMADRWVRAAVTWSISMTGPPLCWVASVSAIWSTAVACVPVRANPPQVPAVKLWVNLRGSRRPSQAIPQRIYISTIESLADSGSLRGNPRIEARAVLPPDLGGRHAVVAVVADHDLRS